MPTFAYQDDLGLPLITPDSPQDGQFWEYLSWEKADKYQAAVIMWAIRDQAATPDAMKKNPTFADLPAVQANQLVQWNYVSPPSFKIQGAVLNTLADEVAGATKMS